jgi:hypothetical protein
MTDWTLVHPAEIARLRSSMALAQRATGILTFAVVCSLATATAVMVAALAGTL